MGKTRSWSVVAAALAALVLSACGGGAELGQGPDGGDPTGPVPSSLTLLVSSPQLASDASDVSDGVTLTAVIKDSNNNVVPDVTVEFKTTDSAEINVVNPAVTDANGRATALITTGGDPQNRTINVTATAVDYGKSATVTIDVIGTTLTISGPDSTQINVPTEYTVLLTDAAGAGISGRTVTISTDAGNTLSATSLTTNAAGQVTVTLNATQANTTLTASALGLTATKSIAVSTDQFNFIAPAENAEINIGAARTVTVRWLQGGNPVPNGTVINFTATRGALSSATATTTNGEASVTITSANAGFSTILASSSALTKPSTTRIVEFVATTPANITVQASPATISASQSSEITAVVRDANNNLVKNVAVDFSLSDSTSGTISTPSGVTNSQGVVKITYTASSQTSATRGVVITGKVRGTSITGNASLTVGGRAVSIDIGFGSEILVRDASTYQYPSTVLVTDAGGNPAPDADVRLTIVPTHYAKGDLAVPPGIIWCTSEDVNNNDILDPGEDSNGNGRLDPGRDASIPSTVTLDETDGVGTANVTYAKDRGRFLRVRVTGVATVAGTEASAVTELVLPIAEGDEDNLPSASPYGVVLNCASPD